ncbi:MAG: hypothetical protein DWH91_00180 [Planctomycetota bacterium]|nr:MAG: hypothetical protein DWH91_00180 [Planctomycetota bacterium]
MMIRNSSSTNLHRTARRGLIVVKSAICLSFVLIFVALVIDVGVISQKSGELQQAADAASISAVNTMMAGLNLSTFSSDHTAAEQTARAVVAQHPGANPGTVLNTVDSDIQFLYSDFDSENGGWTTSPESSTSRPPNAVSVTVRRDDLANSSVSLSFARIAGRESANLNRKSTAAFFPATGIGEGAEILPFAVDATVWTALRLGNNITNQLKVDALASHLDNSNLLDLIDLGIGDRFLDPVGCPVDLNGNPLMIMDRQSWHPRQESISSGADRVWESIFFPHQFERVLAATSLLSPLTGIKYIPGNMVLIDLGQRNSPAYKLNLARIERQIVSGLDYQDVSGINELNGREGGNLQTPFMVPGEYYFPKEIKEELSDSIGKPRILFLYATIPGAISTVEDLLQTPTDFVIVGWVGAVITEVNFDKLIQYVKFQPAPYRSFRLETDNSPTADWGSGVYAGPFLVQ